MGGSTKDLDFIYKICMFILIYLNFSHLQNTLHLMHYTYQDFFPTALNSFWTHQFWCLLVLLPFFVSHLPHWQNVSFWGLFSSGKETNKKVAGARSGEQGGWGTGIMQFWVKNCWTLSTVWAGVILKHPSWNRQARWKSLQKKFTEVEHSLSQQCLLIYWYRWVSRTHTEWEKPVLQGAPLQKIIPVLGPPP